MRNSTTFPHEIGHGVAANAVNAARIIAGGKWPKFTAHVCAGATVVITERRAHFLENRSWNSIRHVSSLSNQHL